VKTNNIYIYIFIVDTCQEILNYPCMHSFYKSTDFHIFDGKYKDFMVGVLFLDKEIPELKESGRWENNLKLKDSLLQEISPIEIGFSDDVKVIAAMDSTLILRKIEFDQDFLKLVVKNNDFDKLQDLTLQAINMATKVILKSIQKKLQNHEISMKDYIDRIILNHENKGLWMNLKSVDEEGKEIAFYATHGETDLSGLEGLGRNN